MDQISSRWTAFTKWVLPLLWVGFLLFFIVGTVLDGAVEKDPLFVLAPIFMIVAGLVMFRVYLWNLADSVYDHGSYLVAKRRGVEVRVGLENIMNVGYSSLSNPKLVTLRLAQSSALGKEIAFIPKTSFSLNPFAKVEVAESLIERTFAARAVKR
jgi:hypothetical protein